MLKLRLKGAHASCGSIKLYMDHDFFCSASNACRRVSRAVAAHDAYALVDTAVVSSRLHAVDFELADPFRRVSEPRPAILSLLAMLKDLLGFLVWVLHVRQHLYHFVCDLLRALLQVSHGLGQRVFAGFSTALSTAVFQPL